MIFEDDTKLERYSLPFAIIIPSLLASFFWTRANEHPIILFGAIIFSYITLIRVVYSYLSIFAAPRIVNIDSGKIYVEMLYGIKYEFNISDLRIIREIPALILITGERSIFMSFEGKNKKLFFSKEYKNVKELFLIINNLNPQCLFIGDGLRKLTFMSK
jgi:hypothetical protein